MSAMIGMIILCVLYIHIHWPHVLISLPNVATHLVKCGKRLRLDDSTEVTFSDE